MGVRCRWVVGNPDLTAVTYIRSPATCEPCLKIMQRVLFLSDPAIIVARCCHPPPLSWSSRGARSSPSAVIMKPEKQTEGGRTNPHCSRSPFPSREHQHQKNEKHRLHSNAERVLALGPKLEVGVVKPLTASPLLQATASFRSDERRACSNSAQSLAQVEAEFMNRPGLKYLAEAR